MQRVPALSSGCGLLCSTVELGSSLRMGRKAWPCAFPGTLVLMPWWEFGKLEGQLLQKGEGQLTLLFRGEYQFFNGVKSRAEVKRVPSTPLSPTFSALFLLSVLGNFGFHFHACPPTPLCSDILTTNSQHT